MNEELDFKLSMNVVDDNTSPEIAIDNTIVSKIINDAYNYQKLIVFLRFAKDRGYWSMEWDDKISGFILTIALLDPLCSEFDFCIGVPFEDSLEKTLSKIHQCYFDVSVEELVENWSIVNETENLNFTQQEILKNAKYCKSRILMAYTEMMMFYNSFDD